MAEEPLNAMMARRVIHTSGMTVARLSLRKDAVVPLHQHVNEQISMVVEGSLLFSMEGTDTVVHAGGVMCIPPGVPHSVTALEDSVAVDVFSPVREDWLRGDDAYLRR